MKTSKILPSDHGPQFHHSGCVFLAEAVSPCYSISAFHHPGSYTKNISYIICILLGIKNFIQKCYIFFFTINLQSAIT